MIDIKTFFEQSEGKWFTQRTRYDLAQRKVENGKAELTVELLGQENDTVINLYNQGKSSLNPDSAQAGSLSDLAGAKISWDNQSEGEQGSSAIVLLPDDQQWQKGQFIQKVLNSESSLKTGYFVMGEDEALTLSTENNSNSVIKERLWFAHPNLRLRTVWQENETGHQGWVMFYSEIRRINA
jgi:hypothetical protein